MLTLQQKNQQNFILTSTCINALTQITSLLDRVEYKSNEWQLIFDLKKCTKQVLDNASKFHGSTYDNMLVNVYEYYSQSYKIVYDYESKQYNKKN